MTEPLELACYHRAVMLCSPRWGRTARSVAAGCALTLSAVSAPHARQQPSVHDLKSDRLLVLQLEPLVADDQPILDVALAGTRLLLLRPSSVAQYEASSDGWRLQDVRPTMSRVWPRDPRGRLTVEKTSLDLFLPGASCRGGLEPLQLTCADGERPWPIGIDNAGVVRSRNYFSAADGYRYYAVAALGRDAGAAWLVADLDGRLTFLDHTARRSAAAPGAGDDVVRIASACAPGSHVLLTEPATIGEADALRLFRVADRRLIAVTPPVVLTGTLTALWPTSRDDVATAVAYNSARQRYEAFQVGVSCGR